MLRIVQRDKRWAVTRDDIVLFETWTMTDAVLIAILSAQPERKGVK